MPDGHVPPLVPLHADASSIASKLQQYDKLSNVELVDSLKPGRVGSLKVRPDGTILDGHHRLKLLRDRGIDVHALDRDIVRKESVPGADEEA